MKPRWQDHLFLAAVAFVTGASLQLNWLAAVPLYRPEIWDVMGRVLLTPVIFYGFYLLLWKLLVAAASRLLAPDETAQFAKKHRWTYLVFTAPALGAFGLGFTGDIGTLLFLLFTAWQGWLLTGALGHERRRALGDSLGWLAFLFFISGFAALIYQVAWQRVLFGFYGVNIESITIIVSIFMLGLGVGALAGGWLSGRFPGRLPELFFLAEGLIALFGVVSLPLMDAVGQATLELGLFQVSAVVYLMLFWPTLMMGATLPVLVAHLHRYLGHVGRSVGLLYAVNTAGSALACLVTANLLFAWTGLQGSVYTAATLNLLTGWLVYRYTVRLRGRAAAA